MATPIFAVSHTVPVAATIRFTRNGTAYTATVAIGTYWVDTVGLAAEKLHTVLATAMAAACSQTVTATMATTEYPTGVTTCGYLTLTTAAGGTLKFLAQDAATNDEGRLILRRLGYPQAGDLAAAVNYTGGVMGGWWKPPRGVSGRLDESLSGETMSVAVADDGTAYPVKLSDPLREYVVSLLGIKSQAVNSRNATPKVTPLLDVSFKGVIHQWLRRGEYLRYYADASGTYTHLTAAQTAATTTAAIAADTGVALNGELCVDGEPVVVYSGAASPWGLLRFDPVPHASGSPVGVGKFVGTYVLAKNGGNINAGQYAPEVRGLNDDRFDMHIALWRATA